MDLIRAIIYVGLGADVLRTEAACLEYCERHGYEVTALVRGGLDSWSNGVFGMLRAGEADVIVVYTRSDLPTDRLPRLEVVVEEASGGHARRPRPRPLDR